jgi:hypothetical protein
MASETKASCLTFVDIHGQISCDLNSISDLIKNADLEYALRMLLLFNFLSFISSLF